MITDHPAHSLQPRTPGPRRRESWYQWLGVDVRHHINSELQWWSGETDTCSPAVQCTQPPIIHTADQSKECTHTNHCSCPDTETEREEHSFPTPLPLLCRQSPESIEMWHVVLLIVSETCVEWRNLGGFRSRVRCPCPQLAVAQWWEAAGRGISCSNYVRCIATLCLWFNQCNAHHQSFIFRA